jgi:hypothetical protein
MDATLQRRLERLKYYATRYELIAQNGNRRILVCYTSQTSRSGILSALRERAQDMARLTGADSVEFAPRAKDGATMGDWTIRLSGRTQREAFIAGELPYVVSGRMLNVFLAASKPVFAAAFSAFDGSCRRSNTCFRASATPLLVMHLST